MFASGDYAFCGCSKIRNINVYKVEEIGTYAFKGCSLTSSLSIWATKIGEYAFDGVVVHKIVIYENFSLIPKNAFSNLGRSSQPAVRFLGNETSEWIIKDTLDGPVIDTITVTNDLSDSQNRIKLKQYSDKYWIKIQ